MTPITRACLFLVIMTTCARSADPFEVSFKLGRMLLEEQQPERASIEFRRGALQAPEHAADLWLHAASAALAHQNPSAALSLLQRAEEAGATQSHDLLILYAQAAALEQKPDETLYFLDLLLESSPPDSRFQTYARQHSAATLLRAGRISEATQRLQTGAEPDPAALGHIQAYAAQHDRKPLIGGLLGLIPGAGYWYSGEFANGFRSLILNALFISAMAYSAEDDQWGAFAALTFFELTWYSGSIYGGIDAAHRHNQDRLDACINQLHAPHATPDFTLPIPLFSLRINL